jgi:putative Holliday junction resolvase
MMAAHETVIAIDFGLRNLGIAVGNTVSNTARPLTVMRARDGKPDWEALTSLLAEWQPDRVLVGHPLNMDGTESEMGLRAKKFSRQVEGRLNITVTMVDERLSSREAKALAREAGHPGDFSNEPVDDQAAAIILTTWLNTR